MSTSLILEPSEFRDHFGRKPFRISHQLTQHELFGMPKLLELAKTLPEHRVEYNAGSLPIGQDPKLTPRTGLSIEETIKRIESCGSWMVLKNIEKHPEYRRLLDACLDEIRAHSEAIDPGMCGRVGFIFISSPNAVTPIHIDPEYNFLLQIRGSKLVHQWNPLDRTILPEMFLEEYFGTAEGHRNLAYKEEYKSSAYVFELRPGDGLHFPYLAPHWVQNGPEVSVSFSITFQTPATEKKNVAYTINSRLRGIGLRPRAVGESPIRDSALHYGYTVFQAARKLLKGSRGEPQGPERKY